MSRAEYMREYRKRNCDKIRATERERSAKRRSLKFEAVDGISGIPEETAKKLDGIFLETPVRITFEPAKPRCMASFCKENGVACDVFGSTVYLCPKHLKEQTK